MDMLDRPCAASLHERRLDRSALGRLTALMFADTCPPTPVPARPMSQARSRSLGTRRDRVLVRDDEIRAGQQAARPKATRHADTTYELRISLDGMDPPIWRTCMVPPDIGLEELHLVVQVVMGWRGRQRHEFSQGRRRYGSMNDTDAVTGQILDEFDFLLADLMQRPRQRLFYASDGGYRWEHTITLVAIRPGACLTPRVIAGERACPPDDCGGPDGYANLLEILGDAAQDDTHPRQKWFHPLLPEGRLPTIFPLSDINDTLARGIDFLHDDAASLME